MARIPHGLFFHCAPKGVERAPAHHVPIWHRPDLLNIPVKIQRQHEVEGVELLVQKLTLVGFLNP
jgi:hypothetical protein